MSIGAVSKFYDICNLPYNILQTFITTIKEYNENQYNHDKAVRMIGQWLKNNTVMLKIQIIKSRAAYETTISNCISDYDFIELCEPQSLVNLGYATKIEESIKLLHLEQKKLIKKSTLACYANSLSFKGTKENNIDPKNYHYNFIDIEENDSQKKVKLLIKNAKYFFHVPFADLLLDDCLLYNIYPPDLMRIGYHLCTLDIKEKNQLTFAFKYETDKRS